MSNHEALPSKEKPQEAGGTRRPSNQEEQVRALIEVYSSIDEDGWEPDPNFVADIMGIVEQAETAARIDELNKVEMLAHDLMPPSTAVYLPYAAFLRAKDDRLAKLKGVSNE